MVGSDFIGLLQVRVTFGWSEGVLGRVGAGGLLRRMIAKRVLSGFSGPGLEI